MANYTKLEYFVPFGQEEFESGKLKLITRYKSDVKFSLKNSNVTKIKIPKNLVNLEPGCFSGCQHLQSIEVDVQNPNLRMEDTILVDIVNNRPIAILGGELPEGITRIDAGLITGSAESVTIPASVTYIAPDAFNDFKGNIIIDEDNETYWSYGNIIFLKADDSVWTFGTNVTWPSTLTTIPNNAFENHIVYNSKYYARPDIETAVIENGVTTIGDYAFKECTELTSVDIPNSITNIGRDAFYFKDDISENLDKINITSIESWCNIEFYNDSSNPLYCGGSLYLNGQKITNLVIPNTITKINEYTFCGYKQLTNVTIPDSVIEIDYYAFNNCKNLTSISVGSGLNEVHIWAFNGCSNVQTVTVSNGNTTFYLGVNGLVRKSDNMVMISGLNFTTPNDPNFTQIGYTELEYNPVKPNLTLSPSIKRIYGKNYYSSLARKIQGITLNNTLEEIGDYTFRKYYDEDYYLENITIPNTVTKIGTDAFFSQKFITSIVIPNSVTSIGAGAFSYTNLTSVVLPNNITEIGPSVFKSCERLTSLNIPASVKSIVSGSSDSSFYGCKNLETITVDPNNTVYDSRNNCNAIIETATNKVILGCKNTVLPNTVTEIANCAFINLDLTNVVIPNSVTKIDIDSFVNCTGGEVVDKITYVGSILLKVNYQYESEYTIREGTTVISSKAFYYCSNATSITIPNSVIQIQSNAFERCSNLTSITIPENVETIGSSAFGSCSKLNTVVINSNKIKRLEDYVFANTKISTINIPDSIEYVSNLAFNNVTTLPVVNYIRYADTIALKVTSTSQTSYTVREGTKILGNALFSGCNKATSISIPEGITSIGDSAFYSCQKLTTLNLPQNLRYLGAYAFEYCYELANPIVIPNQISTIKASTFNSCSKIPSITIGNNVTRINSGAFSGCNGISEVNIDSLEHWLNIDFQYGASPFNANTNPASFKINGTEITTLTIPNSITKIKDYSLSYIGECSTVSSITVPNSVKQVGVYAFNKCYNVDIDISNLEQISNYAFCYTTFTNTNIAINNSVELSGGYNFANSNITTLDYRLDTIPTGLCAYCSNLTSVDLSNSNLSSISSDAFKECTNLTSITIPNSVTSIYGYAFYQSGLTSITIPQNVKNIENYAFGYTNITSLIIPESVTSISNYAFTNCTQLTSVVINGNVGFSSNTIFNGCSNLTDVTINSEYTLSSSTADPFTAATVIKVPCNLYIIALQGIFKNKVQPITEECLQYRWVDDKEVCVIPELHMRQKKQASSNGTNWYDTGETQILPEVLGECTKLYSVELNNGAWVTSTSYGNLSDTSSNYEFYESTNHSDNSSNSMIITINGYDTFTFKVRNYSETGYDYVYVNNLDDLTSTNAYYSNVNKSSPTEWNDVTFSNISAGEHQIKVTYRKDSSSSNYDDKGFVAIPLTQQ